MKLLKPLLVILLSLTVIAALLMVLAPREKMLSRSIRIKAPKSTVFKHIQSFEHRKAWYPWTSLDPNMQTSIEGKDGEVGALYKWSGNEEVGVGEQLITQLVVNEQVDTRLIFKEPFASTSDTYLKISQEGEETVATWGMKAYMPIPVNIMGLFMSFEENVGPDYEQGLKNLKGICESEMAEMMKEAAKQVDSLAVETVPQ